MSPRPLSIRTITLWAVGLLMLAALAIGLLLVLFGGGRPEDAQRLDAIRTAAGIVIGAGGAAALLLAARRQRSTELDLEQTEHDSTERRVTELYGKAADQLGSDKAPVRLAGIYGLERLAQDNPNHRQTIVNLYCAYLRMPVGDGAREEQQVRTAIQDVLSTHLRVPDRHAPPATFWPDIDLNLVGATLERFSLRNCVVRVGVFRFAVFSGTSMFRHTTFTGRADFRNTRFLGLADFRNAEFRQEPAQFQWASFEDQVTFGAGADPAAVNLGAAMASVAVTKRTWPAGWSEHADPQRPEWVLLEPPKSSPTFPAAEGSQ